MSNAIERQDKELREFIKHYLSEIEKAKAFLEEQREKRRLLILEIKAGLYDAKRI